MNVRSKWVGEPDYIIYILLTWAIFDAHLSNCVNSCDKLIIDCIVLSDTCHQSVLYSVYLHHVGNLFCFLRCISQAQCVASHWYCGAAHYINTTIINTTTRKSPASPWPLSFSIAAWQKPVCRWPDISFVYQTAVLEPEPQASQTNNLWRIFLQRCKKTQKAFSRGKKKKVFIFRSARTSQSTFDVRTATKNL